MKNQEIKFQNKNYNYSIIIGENILGILPKKIKLLCPKTKNIALLVDGNVPGKFKNKLKNILKNYNLLFLSFNANEKNKSISAVDYYLNKLFSKNLNRSDLIIAVGGGIVGDVAGFISSIFKRGISFVQIPTTLLSQVDSSVGGKTGVNNKYGKNLIGTFYQPKFVLIDTLTLKSLPKREMVSGFAEILKYSLIMNKPFFAWLNSHGKNIINRSSSKDIINAIFISCKSKAIIVAKDEKDAEKKNKLAYEYYKRFDNMFTGPGKVKNGNIIPLPRKQSFEEMKDNLLICPINELIDKLSI